VNTARPFLRKLTGDTASKDFMIEIRAQRSSSHGLIKKGSQRLAKAQRMRSMESGKHPPWLN